MIREVSGQGYHQLPDGTWKKNPTGTEYEPKPVQVWYMRDNHTFRALPLDVEGALAAMRQERDAGDTYGMLCGKPDGVVPGPVHARSAAMWHNRAGRTAQPVGDDLVGGKWRWVG